MDAPLNDLSPVVYENTYKSKKKMSLRGFAQNGKIARRVCVIRLLCKEAPAQAKGHEVAGSSQAVLGMVGHSGE